MNAWISPKGDIELIGFAGHGRFALALEQEKLEVDEDGYLMNGSGYYMPDPYRAVDAMHDKGWGRVCDWNTGDLRFISPRIRWSSVQIEAVMRLGEITNTEFEWDGNKEDVKILNP